MQDNRIIRWSLRLAVRAVLPAFVFGGCLQWFSDQVGTGVARLTVRNVGAIATALSNDSHCGFASEAVLASYIQEGETGGFGTVTWSVESCTLSFAELTELSRDCQDAVTSAKGALTVTALKKVRGRLTGDPATPVVPESPEAATVEILEAKLDNFFVLKSNSDSALTMKSGSVAGVVAPRLARSLDTGACAISTPNVTFSDIVYTDAELHVETPDRTFDVSVAHSNLAAQNGIWGDQENSLSGSITVWGKHESVPQRGDSDGLDPEYDSKAFIESYSCTGDLEVPIAYSCDLQPALAQGTARLSIRTLGALAKLASSDETCGFQSGPVQASPVTRGAVGNEGGEAVYSIADGCTLSFPAKTALSTDCRGVTTYVQGTAVLRGTMSLVGFATGDPAQPVVPTSMNPALIDVVADLSQFSVSTSDSAQYLSVTGRLGGVVEPQMALDTSTGVCSIATAVTSIRDVRYSNAQVELHADGKQFTLHIADSDLDAVNGTINPNENELTGILAVEGENIVVPVDPADDRLNPDFHPYIFDLGYQCTEDMVVPQTPQDCSFRRTLAQGAARLAMKTFAFITKAVDADTDCGFEGNLVPTTVDGSTAGEMGTMQWQVNSCVLGGDTPVMFAEDCVGKQYFLQGTATVTSTKTASGLLTLGMPPILPQDRTSARFDHSAIVLNELVAYDLAPGETAPSATLTFHSGTMRGAALPITGESAVDEGAYYVKTPISGFEDVIIENVRATLYSDGKTFHIDIDYAELAGFNGSYVLQTNELSGSITVDGEVVEIPIDPEDPTLDPEYDQAALDASYACKMDPSYDADQRLKELVPPATWQ